MKFVLLAIWLLLWAIGAQAQTEAHGHIKNAVMIADAFYWYGPEGNLGLEIIGKFQSEAALRGTFNLAQELGVFKDGRHPSAKKTWLLRDVLVMVNFNGNGSVATWRVCGPKPLLEGYLQRLKKQYADRSLFYDFSYKLVNFKPSND